MENMTRRYAGSDVEERKQSRALRRTHHPGCHDVVHTSRGVDPIILYPIDTRHLIPPSIRPDFPLMDDEHLGRFSMGHDILKARFEGP